MATYVNNLRLKEIATGDESGTWGTSTNTNLELITDGFSYGTKQMSSDANQTFTMPDGTTDATRGFYLKLTSAGSLTATRTVTLGPNTVSKVWLIENSTTGAQSISIKQGSGAEITIANGSKAMVVTDGAGAGAAVFNANPTEVGTGDVTLNGTQTLTNKTLTSPVLGGTTTTASGNMVVSPATQIVEVKGNGSSVEGQIKLNCHANTHGQTLKAQPHSASITNTMLLPIGANSTLVSLISADTLTNKTLTSPALTTPAITTGLDDSAGNLVIPFDSNQYFSGTFSDKVTAAGNTGSALTINANLANVVTATLNGNATLTLATPNAVANRSTSFTLILTNDGTPNRTVALAGGTFYYPGGSISRTTTANAIDIWFFFSPDGGTSWYVTLPMKNLTT